MFKHLTRKRNQKGFTLIEILIVVVIVAILAAISVPIYVEYVKSARASDAKTAISAIWQAAQVYYQERGEYPTNVEDLINDKYLELGKGTEKQWEFNMAGDPPLQIIGSSTELMPGGAGREVIYDIEQGTWRGYGLPNDEGEE